MCDKWISPNMSSSTTNNNNGSAATTPSGGPPPLPATKPVLGSTGSYTAGIHSVNKQHSVVVGEKPVIAARPIPPPTLPKYTSSFGKFDRAEREKVCFVCWWTGEGRWDGEVVYNIREEEGMTMASGYRDPVTDAWLLADDKWGIWKYLHGSQYDPILFD